MLSQGFTLDRSFFYITNTYLLPYLDPPKAQTLHPPCPSEVERQDRNFPQYLSPPWLLMSSQRNKFAWQSTIHIIKKKRGWSRLKSNNKRFIIIKRKLFAFCHLSENLIFEQGFFFPKFQNIATQAHSCGKLQDRKAAPLMRGVFDFEKKINFCSRCNIRSGSRYIHKHLCFHIILSFILWSLIILW